MKKKMSILAVILAAVGLLFLGGCSDHNEYIFDVTGVWDTVITVGSQNYDETYSFVGDIVSGDVYWEGILIGFYTVSGDQIHFKLEYIDAEDDHIIEDFRGYIDAVDQMSGTYTYTVVGNTPVTGSWVALR